MMQLVSSTEPVFQVLVSRRHVVCRDSTTLAYRVKCFLSLPLAPLITLSSSHFTQRKIASKCDITFERYRMLFCCEKSCKLHIVLFSMNKYTVQYVHWYYTNSTAIITINVSYHAYKLRSYKYTQYATIPNPKLEP